MEPSRAIDLDSLDLLTLKEAASVIEAPLGHVSTLAAGGDLPLFRIGRHLRVERREAEAYAEISRLPEVTALHRVRRARLRRRLMFERRLPFSPGKSALRSGLGRFMTAECFSWSPRKKHALLTANKIAANFKISTVAVRHLAYFHALPRREIGNLLRFDLEEVEGYLASVRHEVHVRQIDLPRPRFGPL